MDVSQEKTACSDPSDGTRERERARSASAGGFTALLFLLLLTMLLLSPLSLPSSLSSPPDSFRKNFHSFILSGGRTGGWL